MTNFLTTFVTILGLTSAIPVDQAHRLDSRQTVVSDEFKAGNCAGSFWGAIYGPQTCAALKGDLNNDAICQVVGTLDGYAGDLASNFLHKSGHPANNQPHAISLQQLKFWRHLPSLYPRSDTFGKQFRELQVPRMGGIPDDVGLRLTTFAHVLRPGNPRHASSSFNFVLSASCNYANPNAFR
ncbi:hypothetical protein JX266_014305 [Neoarthrinium moseri]|nr:hypothetical protein JX266_014305 [Neoarthrinium moseri]